MATPIHSLDYLVRMVKQQRSQADPGRVALPLAALVLTVGTTR
jgi:hypothetical protein